MARRFCADHGKTFRTLTSQNISFVKLRLVMCSLQYDHLTHNLWLWSIIETEIFKKNFANEWEVNDLHSSFLHVIILQLLMQKCFEQKMINFSKRFLISIVVWNLLLCNFYSLHFLQKFLLIPLYIFRSTQWDFSTILGPSTLKSVSTTFLLWQNNK